MMKHIKTEAREMVLRPTFPLAKKWAAKYPPIPMLGTHGDCEKISCTLCDRCPLGDLWKVPKEDYFDFHLWRTSMYVWAEVANSQYPHEDILKNAYTSDYLKCLLDMSESTI